MILIAVVAPLVIIPLVLAIGTLGERASRDAAYRMRVNVTVGSYIAAVGAFGLISRGRDGDFGLGFWAAIAMFVSATAVILVEIYGARKRAAGDSAPAGR